MFSRIHRRFTYANVMVTLALVFAMSGGAYAAKRYLITSTKQISPKVLKALQGKTGAAGPAGAAGAAGPAGASVKGETGETGKEGKEGKEGKAGTSVTSKTLAEGDKNCAAGGSEFKAGASATYACNGSPWAVGGTLPKGATETGRWVLEGTASKTEEVKRVAISFPIQLEKDVAGTVVKINETPTGPCEGGTVEKPVAASGNLCVYEGKSLGYAGGLAFVGFLNPGGGNTPETTGVNLFFLTKKTGEVNAEGSFAVTG